MVKYRVEMKDGSTKVYEGILKERLGTYCIEKGSNCDCVQRRNVKDIKKL